MTLFTESVAKIEIQVYSRIFMEIDMVFHGTLATKAPSSSLGGITIRVAKPTSQNGINIGNV